jgi:ribonuclease HIII
MSSQGKIGTDEAGKGDYFGPLVVAAFWVPEQDFPKLHELGIKDSKQLSDKRIMILAKALQDIGHNSIVPIGPEKYNELYSQIKNLNRLLAWGHARAIENILEKVICSEVVSDKFGDESFIRGALLEKGRKVNLIQKVRAEEEPVVAAASILARAEFLIRLQKLSRQIGIELAKGASEKVDLVARKVVQLKGKEYLSQVAKLHFKNTQRVICTESS